MGSRLSKAGARAVSARAEHVLRRQQFTEFGVAVVHALQTGLEPQQVAAQPGLDGTERRVQPRGDVPCVKAAKPRELHGAAAAGPRSLPEGSARRSATPAGCGSTASADSAALVGELVVLVDVPGRAQGAGRCARSGRSSDGGRSSPSRSSAARDRRAETPARCQIFTVGLLQHVGGEVAVTGRYAARCRTACADDSRYSFRMHGDPRAPCAPAGLRAPRARLTHAAPPSPGTVPARCRREPARGASILASSGAVPKRCASHSARRGLPSSRAPAASGRRACGRAHAERRMPAGGRSTLPWMPRHASVLGRDCSLRCGVHSSASALGLGEQGLEIPDALDDGGDQRFGAVRGSRRRGAGAEVSAVAAQLVAVGAEHSGVFRSCRAGAGPRTTQAGIAAGARCRRKRPCRISQWCAS